MEADIALVWLVAAFAIVETGCGGAGGRVLLLELEARGHDLIHKQTGGDSFERIVHRFRYLAFGAIWLGDQFGESGLDLAPRLYVIAPDNLYHSRHPSALPSV